MNNSKRLIRMALALAVITLIGLIFSALALSDIYHQNESNLTSEWNVVRASFLFTLMFVAVSSMTILKLINRKSV